MLEKRTVTTRELKHDDEGRIIKEVIEVEEHVYSEDKDNQVEQADR